ncbi:MAG: DUF2029 domain-containing protein [Acidobacteria bacterium]|nr:DUF2029 domain-containing protein [Acidobacteriota bacterium]
MRLAWIAAAISLTVGIARSLTSSGDFASVMAAAAQVATGVSPYRVGPPSDYPPWALMTLAPWTWWPDAWQLPLWVVVNAGLALWLVWSLSRVSAPGQQPDRLMAALLLCASCFRVLNQFSLLSMACAWKGVRHQSAWVGGLWLGLALMKPQVGGVFWVAHLLLGDWRRVGVAACVPLVLTVFTAGLVGQPPWTLVQEAAAQLAFMQGSAVTPPGHTELRLWLVQLWPDAMSLWFAAALTVGLMAPVIRPRWRDEAWRSDAGRMAMYGFVATVSLLAVRHLSYDFMLLLPLLASRRSRPIAFLVLWIPLVVQIPGWWRQVLEPVGAPAWLSILTEADRLFVLLVWLGLSRRPA